ncbi:MAG: deoxyribodipyrimidine photolyase, partial [Deltaproteobacteria bacterium]
MNPVSEFRIHACNDAPVNPRGEYILYWMIANRRTEWNFSLQRAVEWARELDKPIVVFEALRCGYQWASDRLHWFIIQGMKDNAERLDRAGVLYIPYLERERDAGKGLLSALADRACVVVTDDFPSFFLPRMVASAAAAVPVLLEKVDSNGMLPMSWTDKVFSTAFSFRRFLQKNIEPHLHSLPASDPLAETRLPGIRALPKTITKRW